MPKKLISYDEDVEAGERLPEVVKTEILAYTEFSAMPEVLSDLDTSVTGAELDTLAADAVLNTDTSTTNMAFVIDEDSFETDSDTLVPTQQSVKAYVDAVGGGGGGTFNLNPTATKTSDYTASAGDWIPVDASGGAVAITLPDTPTDGSLVGVYLVDTALGEDVTLVAWEDSELHLGGAVDTEVQLYSATANTPLSLWRYEATGDYWTAVSYSSLPLAADIQDSSALGRAVLTAVAATSADGDVLSVELSGASIVVKENGSTIMSLTGQTDLQTATKYGMWSSNVQFGASTYTQMEMVPVGGSAYL